MPPLLAPPCTHDATYGTTHGVIHDATHGATLVCWMPTEGVYVGLTSGGRLSIWEKRDSCEP